MKNWIVLASLFSAFTAHAGEITGRSTLTLWFDQGGVAVQDLRQEDGRVLGNTDLSSNGVFNLAKEGNTYKGFADDGFVDLTCDAGSCSGIVGSDTTQAKFTFKNGKVTMEGSMNHVFISAEYDGKKLVVYGDGSLELRRRDSGTWTGSGFYNQSIQSRFQAELAAEGTLLRSELLSESEDLGLFLIQIVAPLVRN